LRPLRHGVSFRGMVRFMRHVLGVLVVL
jgi:hypothetical protein